MAKNDEFNFEDDDGFDLDMSDDGEGGFDTDFTTDNRKPVTRFVGGAVSGIGAAAMDPEKQRRLVKTALPPGYDVAYDAATGTVAGVRDLYDTVRDEVGVVMKDVKQGVGKILPSVSGVLPKGISNRLKDWADSGSDSGGGAVDYEQMEIDSTVGSIFGNYQPGAASAAAPMPQTRSPAGDPLDGEGFNPLEAGKMAAEIAGQVVNAKMSEQSNSLLVGVSDSLSKLVSYQDQVTIQYQKKSLELQFKQVFNTRKLLDVTQQFFDMSKDANEKIVKNTGLPDLVKVHGTELAAQQIKQKFLGELIAPYTLQAGDIGRKILDKTKTATRSFFSDIGGAISGGLDAAGIAADMSSMGDDDNLSDEEKAQKQRSGLAGGAAEGAGSWVGSTLFEKGAFKLGQWMRENVFHDDNTAARGLAIKNAMKNLPYVINDILKNGSGIEALDKFKDWIDAEDMAARRNTTVMSNSIDELDKATYFDLQTKRTITDIIPQYLASMDDSLRKLQSKGKDKDGPKFFNFKTNRMETMKQITDRDRSELIGENKKESATDAAFGILTVLDPDNMLSDGMRKKILQFAIKKAQDRDPFSIEDMLDPDKGIDDPQEELLNHISDQMGISMDSMEMGEDGKRNLSRIWNSIKDPNSLQSEKLKEALIDKMESLRRETYNYDELKGKAIKRASMGSAYLQSAINAGSVKFDDKNATYEFEDSAFYDQISTEAAKRRYVRPEPKEDDDEVEQHHTGGIVGAPGAKKIPNPFATAPKYHTGGVVGEAANIEVLHDDMAPGTFYVFKSDGTSHQVKYPGITGRSTEKQIQKAIANITKTFQKQAQQPTNAPTPGLKSNEIPAILERGEEVLPRTDPRHQENISKRFDELEKLISGHVGGKADGGMKAGKKSLDDLFAEQNKHLEDLITLAKVIAVGTGAANTIEKLGDKIKGMDINLKGLKINLKGRLPGRIADKIWDTGKSVTDSVFKFSKAGLSIGTSAVGFGLGKAWDGTKNLFGIAKERISTKYDIYVKGVSEKFPVIEARLIKAGEYLDVNTGKIIKSVKDITGEVRDRAGNVALTVDDFKKGLTNNRGMEVLKSVGSKVKGLYDIATAPIKGALTIAKGALGLAIDVVRAPYDVYVKGEESPRLLAYLFRQGAYRLKESGKVLNHPTQISGEVVWTKEGQDETIISMDDIRTGLTNKDGDPVKTMGQKVADIARLPFKALKWAGKKAIGALKTAWDFSSALVSSIGEKLFGGKEGKGFSLFATQKKVVNKLEDIYNLLDQRLPGGKKKVLGDNDGDGDSDTGLDDLRQDVANRDEQKQKGKLASMWESISSKFKRNKKDDDQPTPAPRGNSEGGGLLSGLLGGGGLMKKLILGLMGTFATKLVIDKIDAATGGVIKETFSGITESLGLGPVGTAVAAGGALLAAKKGLGLAITKGIPAVGRGLMTALPWVGRGLLAIGGGLLSAPVALAAGVALTAYGAYKGYKYLTAKDAPIMRLRMAQYGYDLDDEDEVTPILKMEAILLEKIRVSKGQPATLGQADGKELAQLFNVDLSNQEQMNKWARWFGMRFKPVFLSHVTALFSQHNSKDLHDADNMMGRDAKIRFIKSVHYNDQTTSPCNNMESPFGTEDEVDFDAGDVQDEYEDALSDAEDEDQKSANEKNGVKKVDPKPTASGGPTSAPPKPVGFGPLKSNANTPSPMLLPTAGGASYYMGGGGGGGYQPNTGFIPGTGPMAIPQNLGKSPVVGNVQGGGSLAWSKKMSPTLFTNIQAAAAKYGIDENYMKVMAFIESRGDATASNPSGAKGIYQFVPSTARAYGIGGREFDEAANVDAGARFVKDNYNAIKKRLGRDPEPWMLYVAHQQGMGGLFQLLNAANGGPISAQLRRNMDANGGSGLSAAQFLQKWKSKYDGYLMQMTGKSGGVSPLAVKGTSPGLPSGGGSGGGGGGGSYTAPSGPSSAPYLPPQNATQPQFTAASSSAPSQVSFPQSMPGTGATSQTQKMAEFATARALKSSSGRCAQYVSDAMIHAGYKITRGNADTYIERALIPAGFKMIPWGTSPQVGDIVHWSRSPKHRYGHIQIWNGRNWISDFVQNRICPWSDPDGSKATHWRDGKAMQGAPAQPYQPGVGVTTAATTQSTTVSTSTAAMATQSPKASTTATNTAMDQMTQAARQQEAISNQQSRVQQQSNAQEQFKNSSAVIEVLNQQLNYLKSIDKGIQQLVKGGMSKPAEKEVQPEVVKPKPEAKPKTNLPDLLGERKPDPIDLSSI